MPRDLSSPDTRLRTDEEGWVRQVSHPFESASEGRTDALRTAAPDDKTFHALAETYLQETARVFGIEALQLSKQDYQASWRVGRIKQAVGHAVTVTFDQYVDDWPVWRAGVTVRIDARRMRVTGAHNTSHLHIRLHRCSADAPFAPARIEAGTLTAMLGLDPPPELRVTSSRTLVYPFTQANRLASAAPPGASCPPPLAIREPPPAVLALEGMHCVATEVLFTIRMKGWGGVSCRAFLEPDTGGVLYFRTLLACARSPTAMVFPHDPASLPAPGDAAVPSPASPVADLNALRQSVRLQGLSAPDASGRQGLAGEFIKLVNLEDPPTPMPLRGNPFKFEYSCDSADFAACSAYYHCDNAFRTVRSLGIDVRQYFIHTSFPVTVDPHAFHQGVNAQAVGNWSGRGLAQLMFGSASDGTSFGIAADPRVVLHEFGHAVLWEHIGSPYFPFAHSPGDSLAAILHAPYSKARDPGNTFPFLGHLAGFDRRHDRKVEDGWGWFGDSYDGEYGGEQVLSTSLFRLYEAAGGSSAKRAERIAASRYVVYLLLTAIALLENPPDQVDVLVDALIEADALTESFDTFAGGALGKAIRWAFEQQGLYRPADARGISLVPGAPPPVDVYIDDGRNGGYLPWQPDFQHPPGLWNRHAPDAGNANQAPNIGVPNFAYAEIFNRGTSAATGVEFATFQAADGGQRRWANDWVPVPGGQVAVPQPIPPGGSKVVGPFTWTPQALHDHLLVFASASGDRSGLLAADPAGHPVDPFVRLDNNIVERRF